MTLGRPEARPGRAGPGRLAGGAPGAERSNGRSVSCGVSLVSYSDSRLPFSGSSLEARSRDERTVFGFGFWTLSRPRISFAFLLVHKQLSKASNFTPPSNSITGRARQRRRVVLHHRRGCC